MKKIHFNQLVFFAFSIMLILISSCEKGDSSSDFYDFHGENIPMENSIIFTGQYQDECTTDFLVVIDTIERKIYDWQFSLGINSYPDYKFGDFLSTGELTNSNVWCGETDTEILQYIYYMPALTDTELEVEFRKINKLTTDTIESTMVTLQRL